VYSLSIPDFHKSTALHPDWYSAVSSIYGDVLIGKTIGRVDTYNIRTGKKLWEGSQWDWNGIYDGWIYFSAMDADGEHTSVNKIRVDSGERALVYREPLPLAMQVKVKQPKAEPERPLEGDYRR